MRFVHQPAELARDRCRFRVRVDFAQADVAEFKHTQRFGEDVFRSLVQLEMRCFNFECITILEDRRKLVRKARTVEEEI